MSIKISWHVKSGSECNKLGCCLVAVEDAKTPWKIIKRDMKKERKKPIQ